MYKRLPLITLILLTIIGCSPSNSSNEFVARVGESYLLNSDVIAKLKYLPPNLDSTEAKSKIINQWISDELLYQEALRQDLNTREDIQRRLNESARSVLIDGIISEFNLEADNSITFSEIEEYYEAHSEQLLFFEPFVKIRYLTHHSRDTLMIAMQELTEDEASDSVFEEIVYRYSISPEAAIKITENYFLENALFVDNPVLNTLLRNTVAGSFPQIVEANSTYHLLQVLDRSPAGDIPELPWIEGFIQEQLQISQRRQNFSRNIHRLRLDAQYKDKIEIR
ncbi:MAG: hypothetical protein OXF08_11995 [Bacteroidetes bacterium]|nr:hypothetical protein [Bacteroidota bacterium]